MRESIQSLCISIFLFLFSIITPENGVSLQILCCAAQSSVAMQAGAVLPVKTQEWNRIMNEGERAPLFYTSQHFLILWPGPTSRLNLENLMLLCEIERIFKKQNQTLQHIENKIFPFYLKREKKTSSFAQMMDYIQHWHYLALISSQITQICTRHMVTHMHLSLGLNKCLSETIFWISSSNPICEPWQQDLEFLKSLESTVVLSAHV